MSASQPDAMPQAESTPSAQTEAKLELDGKGTPYKWYREGHIRYRAKPEGNAPERQEELYTEMAGRIVGLPSPAVFMDELMGPRPPNADFSKADFSKVVDPKETTEAPMYRRLFAAIRNSGVMKKLAFRITADASTSCMWRPDGGVKERGKQGIDRSHLSRKGRPKPKTIIESQTDDGGNDHNDHNDDDVVVYKPSGPDKEGFHVFNFHEDGMQAELKRYESDDPVHTYEEAVEAGYLERNTVAASHLRGQLASYATQMFAHQHRTHLFQLVIFGKFVRFLRWDRAGAIISERFDYTQDSETLADFLFRYDNMDDSQRGWDPTAFLATEKERDEFNKAVDQFIANMENKDHPQMFLPGAYETLKEGFPIYRVQIFDGNGPTKEALVRSPFYHPYSPCGRATRIYLAYIPKEGMKCLKDTWRVEHPQLLTESAAYDMLQGTPNVPQDVIAGDVVYGGEVQRTITQEWAVMDEEWKVKCGALREHKHTRVLQELYYPVEAAKSSKQYVMVIYQCIMALLAAFSLGINHRDISLGNILMDMTLNGILSDWDHASWKIPGVDYAYQSYRTGTWQFMSIALLQDLKKKHDVLDDLESCFWVLLYAALHFFANKISPHPHLFDEMVKTVLEDGIEITGGYVKSNLIMTNFRNFRWECEALQELMHTLRDTWREYYVLYEAWKNTTDPSLKETKALLEKRKKAKKVLEAKRLEMVQPSFWHEIFQEALSSEDWLEADAIPDRDPREASHTHNKKMREKIIHSSYMQTSMTGGDAGSNLPVAPTSLLPLSPNHLAELRILANPANSSIFGTAPTGSGSAMYRSQTPPRSHKRTLSDYEPNPEALASPRESKKPRTMSPPVASEWDSDNDCDSLYMDELDALPSSPLAGKGKGKGKGGALPDGTDNEEVSRARTESGASAAETGSVASVEDGAAHVSPARLRKMLSKTLGFPSSKA